MQRPDEAIALNAARSFGGTLTTFKSTESSNARPYYIGVTSLGHKSTHMTAHYSAADIGNLVAASEKVCELAANLPRSRLCERGQVLDRVLERDGLERLDPGILAALDDAVAAFNPNERIKGKTIIRVRSRATRVRQSEAAARQKK